MTHHHRYFSRPGEPVALEPLVAAVATPGDWRVRAAEIRARWHGVLGHGPPEPAELGWRITGTARTDSYLRHEVAFVGATGDDVSALLLVPHGITARRPAVLVLHQTVPQGKQEPAGLDGDPELAMAHELAKAGYLVMAPDEFIAGERAAPDDRVLPGGVLAGGAMTDFERHYPRWSAVGRMIGDHVRAVTALRGLDTVDPTRIGVVGHSLGGLNAWWLLVEDPRVRVAVVSCGFGTLAGDPWPQRWAADGYFRYFHPLRDALLRHRAPFDFHEVVALAAPRALFLWAAQDDQTFPHWRATVAATDAVRDVYRLLGAVDQLDVVIRPGRHAFPRAVRERAYRFLRRHLDEVPAGRLDAHPSQDSCEGWGRR